jgi:hypothetical protein
MFVAYAFFEKTWVGTGAEMLSIFVWAFGVDITSDTVLNAAKKIGVPQL